MASSLSPPPLAYTPPSSNPPHTLGRPIASLPPPKTFFLPPAPLCSPPTPPKRLQFIVKKSASHYSTVLQPYPDFAHPPPPNINQHSLLTLSTKLHTPPPSTQTLELTTFMSYGNCIKKHSCFKPNGNQLKSFLLMAIGFLIKCNFFLIGIQT